MAFQNRVASNINRKRLDVVGQPTKDAAGNITSLVVDVVRADGPVSNEGTPLTAEKLNEEIAQAVQKASMNGQTATTACECDYSNKVATTAFVWDVLTALGLTKIAHNHNSYSGSSGSSGGGS